MEKGKCKCVPFSARIWYFYNNPHQNITQMHNCTSLPNSTQIWLKSVEPAHISINLLCSIAVKSLEKYVKLTDYDWFSRGLSLLSTAWWRKGQFYRLSLWTADSTDPCIFWKPLILFTDASFLTSLHQDIQVIQLH